MSLPELQFEWDQAKAEANIVKHGVDFLTAAAAFDNELIQWTDDREDYGEIRIIALGRAEAEIFRVIYTQREPNTVRIISAQKAKKHERELYYRQVLS
jgi:uncharacterized DUF497 family protein